MNYGAIGAIIGHELNHAFDIRGKRKEQCYAFSVLRLYFIPFEYHLWSLSYAERRLL